MASSSAADKETVETRSVAYKKEFEWKIENFEDWWSSRELAQSERMENDNSTGEDDEEDLQIEEPKDWSKSTYSPILTFEVEGTQHEFMLAILKYDSYDVFDKDHNEMMGISLYYNGPVESVIVKPTFLIQENATDVQYPLKAKKLKKNAHSDCRVWNSHNIMVNKESTLPGNQLSVRCLVQINILKNFQNIRSLEKHVLSKKTWNQCLLDGFDFNSTNSDWDQFSDFEIICLDQNENGDNHEKRFRCHKLVLSLGSKYYKRMFLGNYSEVGGTTTVTDIASETMTKLLQYIYSGEVKKHDVDINLLLAADKYEISHLHSICELELVRSITIENAPDLSIVANMCGSGPFKDHVYSFVRKNWAKITESKQSEILQKNPAILCEILDRTLTS